jgi:hypothetical protein
MSSQNEDIYRWATTENRTLITGTTNRSNKPLYDSRHESFVLIFMMVNEVVAIVAQPS